MVQRGDYWRLLISTVKQLYFGWLTVPRATAILLGLLGVLVGFGGYLYHHCECQSWPNLVAGWEQEFEAFYANVATTLVGITIAVLTIDWSNERRSTRQLRAQLIREMGNPDNGIALRAAQELFAHRWTMDGSLRGVHLNYANLQGVNLGFGDLQGISLYKANLRKANLFGADLQKADLLGADLQEAYLDGARLQKACLYGVNLQRAILRSTNLEGAYGLGQQLLTVSSLRDATLFSGERYDGRFNLTRDIEEAEHNNVNPNDPETMAAFYGVPLEAYLAGQEWARENLPRLRREAGVEQEDAKTADVQQPEEPHSAPPNSSAPPSPVVPTQSLLAFTVRRLIGLFWPFGR